MTAYRKFARDPCFLLRYFVVNAILFSGAAVLWAAYGPSVPTPGAFAGKAALVVAGVLFGLVLSTAFHNAAHGNIRPRWLNEVIGEFAGAFMLDGLRNFCVAHTLHHQHADDPDRDPHPPQNQSFWHFLRTSKAHTIAVVRRQYFAHHSTQSSLFAWHVRTFYLAFAAKLIFWITIFGPTYFALFYVPSFLAYVLAFAHLNYITHLPDADGVVRIKDLDHNLYYKIMNVITSGGYYHASHHLRPWHYDPRQGQPVGEAVVATRREPERGPARETMS